MRTRTTLMIAILAAMLALGFGQTVRAVDFVPTVFQDIGNPPTDPSIAGSYVYDLLTNSYTLTGSGSDWWDSGEHAYVAGTPMSGDWRIETNLTLLGTAGVTDGWMKAGIFVRNGLANEQEVNAISAATWSNGGTFQWRLDPSAGMGNATGGSQPTKVALQCRTVGATAIVEGFVDSGSGWERRGVPQYMTNLSATPYAGLFVTSHNNSVTEQATFANAVVAAPVIVPLPDARTLAITPPQGGAGVLGIREVLAPDGVNLNNLDDTVNLLNSGTGTVVDYQASQLNIWDSDGNGHFGDDAPFGVVTAGHRTQGGVDNLAMVASGNILVPTSGLRTFCVNSDDGFELAIDGKIVAEANYGKGSSDVFGVAELTAGVHSVRVLYWEGGGGSSIELFSAAGAYGDWAQTTSWALVGDTANGGLALVPEPASLTLLTIGGLALLWWRRRR